MLYVSALLFENLHHKRSSAITPTYLYYFKDMTWNFVSVAYEETFCKHSDIAEFYFED